MPGCAQPGPCHADRRLAGGDTGVRNNTPLHASRPMNRFPSDAVAAVRQRAAYDCVEAEPMEARVVLNRRSAAPPAARHLGQASGLAATSSACRQLDAARAGSERAHPSGRMSPRGAALLHLRRRSRWADKLSVRSGNEGVPQRRAPQRRPPHALTESVSRWPGNPGNVASSELRICAGPESMSEWSMRACRAGRPRRAPPAKVRAALY